MKTLTVKSRKATEFIDITREVEGAVAESGVREGVVTVYTPHTTTAILINENDPRLLSDYEKILEKLVPKGAGYAHDPGEGNAHAHLRSALIGPAKSVPVSAGRPVLGTWQRIFFVELDGPRTRRVMVQAIQ
ncbi:MAG: YjbQ family protein [Euryarchaeota archaeon]|nr:YjbQ family protein [Euryarchaeota archaeon]